MLLSFLFRPGSGGSGAHARSQHATSRWARAGEERRRSLALRASGACACAEGGSPPSRLPLPRPRSPVRRRVAGRRRPLPGACASPAPPRSQRAPRGEEAAAAGWGHFVSAVAGVERQDGGGGRVRDRRRPRPGGASGLRVSLPLPPLPTPALTAPRWPPLVFSGGRREPSAARLGSGTEPRRGAPAGGARLELSSGDQPSLFCPPPPPLPSFPSPAPFPSSGAAVEPSFCPRASQRREGPSAAPRHGE